MRDDDAVSRAMVSEFAALKVGSVELSAQPALEEALRAAARSECSVLDWGGGVGLNRLLAGFAAPDLSLDWHVVDTSSRCAHGVALRPDVAFHSSLAEAGDRRFDLVLADTAIGAEPDWQETLRQLQAHCGQVLLLDRIAVTTGRRSFIARHHAAEWPAGTRFTSWILEEEELFAALRSAGLVVTKSWVSEAPDQPFGTTQRLISIMCAVSSPTHPAGLSSI
jgi:putative methyltransferase (TIGR04325 family)